MNSKGLPKNKKIDYSRKPQKRTSLFKTKNKESAEKLRAALKESYGKIFFTIDQMGDIFNVVAIGHVNKGYLLSFVDGYVYTLRKLD